AGADAVIDAAREAIAASGIPLRDPDTQVRRLGIDAMLQGATAFREVVPEPYPVSDFPPKGRALTPNDMQKIRSAQTVVGQVQANFAPLIQAARVQARVLAQALTDPDGDVREKARNTLEMYANARLRLRRLADSVPELPAGAAAAVQPALAQKDEK